MTRSRAQIVATIGPASAPPHILRALIEHQVDVVRFNFSWGELSERTEQIQHVRECGHEFGRPVPIIIDLPGPRIQQADAHTYEHNAGSVVTERDTEFIRFGVEHGVEYVALSFVSGPEDVEAYRKVIQAHFGTQKIVAKIERAVALDSLDAIIATADAIMIARGDLGNEVPLEQIPFIQERIIRATRSAEKPVITATQMLLSMVEEPAPTRAEVTDVTNAILQGSDAVMLSEETTIGAHPVEAVIMMEKILIEAEKHMPSERAIHTL